MQLDVLKYMKKTIENNGIQNPPKQHELSDNYIKSTQQKQK
jgi:hypothetical protein